MRTVLSTAKSSLTLKVRHERWYPKPRQREEERWKVNHLGYHDMHHFILQYFTWLLSSGWEYVLFYHKLYSLICLFFWTVNISCTFSIMVSDPWWTMIYAILIFQLETIVDFSFSFGTTDTTTSVQPRQKLGDINHWGVGARCLGSSSDDYKLGVQWN